MVQKGRKKEQKQHINGTESPLLKRCTTTGVQNCDQKTSDWPDSGVARNPLRSGRCFPTGNGRFREHRFCCKSSFAIRFPI
ncbi:hypothetical protein TNCV_103511 [Trichonephila clavipes]|nr:hypothetical protein TNCV_103511 [Trichonephila clavipes]